MAAWVAAHPAAQQPCGLVVRYRNGTNGPIDSITATANGAEAIMNSNGDRVVEALLWDTRF